MPRNRISVNSPKYKVLSDPAGLFLSSIFPRYDFVCSLAGKVWAEGMVVRDPDHKIMEVSYPWIEGNQMKVLTDKTTGQRWRVNKHQSGMILLEE